MWYVAYDREKYDMHDQTRETTSHWWNEETSSEKPSNQTERTSLGSLTYCENVHNICREVLQTDVRSTIVGEDSSGTTYNHNIFGCPKFGGHDFDVKPAISFII